MSLRRFLLAVLFVALTLALLIPLTRFLQIELSSETLLTRELRNFGHVPLFGGIALSLLGLSRVVLGQRVSRAKHYLLALVCALALGVASEAAQFWGPRDADLLDLARNVIGASAVLLFVAGLDGALDGAGSGRLRRVRPTARWVAVALVLLGLLPLAATVHAYRARSSRLPALCGFDSFAERTFLRTRGAALLIGDAPEGWDKPSGDRVGRLNFGTGRWPSLTVDEPYPDWSDYEALELSVFSEQDGPVALGLRIDDRTSTNRYHRRIELRPGFNRVRVPLEQVRVGPPDGEIDLQQIRWIILYAIDPAGAFGVYLDDIELSRPQSPPPSARRGGD